MAVLNKLQHQGNFSNRMKTLIWLTVTLLCILSLFSCTDGKQKDSVSVSQSDEVITHTEDTLLSTATWYLYSLNCGESSRLVNLVNDEGEILEKEVPIVTVPFKLAETEIEHDTTTYTYSLREDMNPAGNYNALFYKITFVNGNLYSAKNDGGFIADLRKTNPDSNTLFLSEMIVNKNRLTPFLLKEAKRRKILE